VDTTSMEVLELETISPEVTCHLVQMLRKSVPGSIFAVEEMDRFAHEPGFIDPAWGWDDTTEQVDDVVLAVAGNCIKLVMRVPGWNAATLLHRLQQEVIDDGHVTSSGLDWVEIGAPGISKASAAERICGRLGVLAGEVLAIGDNHNDLAALAWAGYAAAPANAIPEVLAAVHEVIPSNGQDGVAQILERLVAVSASLRDY
jgi:hypothetical protein